MHIWLHRLEFLIDQLVPPMFIALLILIIGQLFFLRQFQAYMDYATIIDWIVVSVLVIDLIFKYIRKQSKREFLRRYWLEILAVLPFFLIFRVAEFLFPAFYTILMAGQAGISLEAAQLGRTSKMVSMLKLLGLSGYSRAAHFFEKPTGKHHHGEKNSGPDGI
jgi:hypothetical protein